MSNKYTYSVPFTEDELFDCYENKAMSQVEIAKRFKTSQHVVWRAMKKMGLTARVAKKRNQKGNRNSSWRGGRVLMGLSKVTRFSDRGYWYIHQPNHPNATKNGYVAEHIAVASKTLGRPLKKGECVHHLDMNKHNNAPDNLVVCTRKEHREFHLQLELIAVELFRCGELTFKDGRYCFA